MRPVIITEISISLMRTLDGWWVDRESKRLLMEEIPGMYGVLLLVPMEQILILLMPIQVGCPVLAELFAKVSMAAIPGQPKILQLVLV